MGFTTLTRRAVCSITAPALLLMLGLAVSDLAWARGPLAYIANYNSGTVSVIDTNTNTVTATVPMGGCPDAVAVAPNGRRYYVSNECLSTVFVFDAATNLLIAAVPVGIAPFGLAMSSDGARLYVADEGSNSVSVIATASNTVTATVGVGAFPFGVALTPDGARLYVANCESNTVSVIATATNTVTATLPAGDCPSGVAVTPNGARAYVTNAYDNTISVIATATDTVIATLPMGAGPQGIAITSDGSRAYVANQFDSTVQVLATASNTVIATIPVGAMPQGAAFTPDGSRLYVPNGDSNNVSVIAAASNTVTATVPVGAFPASLAFFIGSFFDADPPTLSAHADVSKEATSSAGANVTYALPTATDDVAVASVVCLPPSGTQFALGNTPVTCTATDTSGNSSQSTFTVRVVDTTPPKVTVPTTVSVPKSSSTAGTVVTFVATATDLVDGTVAVSCTPASGSLFAPGDTTVRCTATDTHGNSSVATFTVHVSALVEQIQHLLDLIAKLGPGQSLKAATGLATLAQANPAIACRVLAAVLAEVKEKTDDGKDGKGKKDDKGKDRDDDGKKIPPAKAAEIITVINQIRATLACS